MRIAVTSDTHELADGWGLPPEMMHAFRGVDLILHCGDLEMLGVLDQLQTLAPVLAVRGYKDPHEPGDRLAERTRVVAVEGVRIGMVHDLRWPGPPILYNDTLEFPPGPVQEALIRKFGQPVDIVCFGDVHEELLGWYQGVLFVNPGSPTHPGLRHPHGDLGTVAYLNIKNGVASAEIHKLLRGAPSGDARTLRIM
ncbi:MAG: metallophosphoesterase family protein [Chloroflexi bacterium]|nr:metallophosphoesterase family protein [Chloroflexota bacterium]